MSADLNRRLASLYSRGVVRQADVAAWLMAPQVEYLANEVRRTEAPFFFGFSAMPLAGAEAHAIFFNGTRDSPVAFSVTDRRYAPLDLQQGETMFWGLQARTGPNYHWIRTTASPKPGTIKAKASRIELRAGQNYILLDADPTIGAQKGIYDPTQELPLNPHGAAL